MAWFLCLWAVTALLAFGATGNNELHKMPPSAVIVGTVYCDTCFHHYSTKSSRFIAGATVAVECNNTSPNFRREVQTDRKGEFKVQLPLAISKHIKKIKGCSVRLIRSSQPYCAIAAAAASSSLQHLKSKKDGTHVFSAGFFTFKPLEQPQLCDQKPSVDSFNKLDNNLSPTTKPDDHSFPPPLQDPPAEGWYLPPLPRLPPLPSLPRLPPLPGLPILPPSYALSDKAVNKPMEVVVPQDPSFVIPPAFPSPPLPPPLFQLPPVPGLTPAFPIPVPSIPSMPGFPGVPAAEVSSKSRTFP